MRRTIWVAALAALVGAAVAAPVAVLASHSFTDVADTNVFHADIDWLRDSGVTKGCNPPANTEFCPNDVVTRETMAAFLHRLAVNKVVNAATAIEAASALTATNAHHATIADSATTAGHANSADTADSATSADDADTVDGKHASEFLGSNDAATDADKVDGFHANELTRVALGSGDQALTLVTGFQTHSSVTIEAPQAGFILVTAGVTIQNDQVDPCLSDCEIMAVIEYVAGGQTAFSVVGQMDAAAGSQQAVPLTWVFPVQAGSQLFELNVRRPVASGGIVEAQFSQITALYSPFGASGDLFPNLSGSG